jgi:cell surface antigen I/II
MYNANVSQKTTGRQVLRTRKGVGLVCGIALSTALFVTFSGAHVSADEVSANATNTGATVTEVAQPTATTEATAPATTTPATTAPATSTPAIDYASGADNASTVVATNLSPALNNAEAQPVATKENVTAEKSANQTNGEVRVDVKDKAHDDAVAEAKKEGIEVKEQPKETAKDLADAQGKLKTETTAIKTATAEHVKAKGDFAKATDLYNQAQKANDEVTNEANAARGQGVEVNIKTAEGTSEQAIKEAPAQKAMLQETVKTYKQALEAYQVSKKEYESASEANATVNRKVEEAKAAGVTVTTHTEKVKAEEVVAKAQEQIKILDQAIASYTQAKKDFDAKKISTDQLNAVNKKVQDAIDGAKALGITVNVNTVTTSAEEAEKGSQATIDAINKTVEKFKSDKAKHDSNAQATDASKATYDKAVASRDAQVNDAKSKGVSVKDASATATNYEEAAQKVAEEQKANEAITAKFEKDKADAQANTSKEGYLPVVLEKALDLNRSTASKVVISDLKNASYSTMTTNGNDSANHVGVIFNGFGHDGNETDDPAQAYSPTHNPYGAPGSYHLTSMSGNFSFTATYTNVDGITYKGKPISKVVYKVEGLGDHFTSFVVYNDPTSFIEWANPESGQPAAQNTLTPIKVTPTYYDADGNVIDVTNGLYFQITSLDNAFSGTKGVEWVSGEGGEFITINGSTIVKHDDGRYYSDNPNQDRDHEHGYAGYTGVVFKPTSQNFSLTLGSDHNDFTWNGLSNNNIKDNSITPAEVTKTNFNVNTPNNPTPEAKVDATLYNVETPKTPDAPKTEVTLFEAEKPVEPKTPKVDVTLYNPKKPVAPTSSIDAHSYDVAQKPTISKAVKTENGSDANGKKVAKGSVVEFELVTNPLKAGRKVVQKGTFQIDDALPSGYQVDLEATKAKKGNEAYNVLSFDVAKNILKVVLNDVETDKLNENLDKDYDAPNFTVVGRVLNDNATYKNTYELHIGNDYNVKSNTVTVYTPGGEDPNEPDPKNPNNPHGGSNIEPVKYNTDKNGNDISGKQLMAGSVANYVGKFDLDQFKGTVENTGNHAFIDQWEKGKLAFNPADTAITTSAKVGEGDKVSSDLFDVVTIDDINNIKDQATKDLLSKAGIKLDAKYALTIWKAKDSNAFFEKYVKTGTNLYFHMPMTLTKDSIGSDVTNRVDQINFDNGYAGNVVVNHVPKVTPEKDVVIKVGDTENIDGHNIELGQVFNYELKGGVVPAEAVSGLFQYGFRDKLDLEHDQFTGTEVIKLGNDVTLKDGTVVKAEDAAKHGKSTFKDGVWSFEFDKDFLDNLSGKENFSATAFIEVKRIAYGDAYNEYDNIINDVVYLSNRVVTHTPTPTPEKPQTPTPTPSNPQAPAPKAGNPGTKVLPNTGEAKTGVAFAGFMALVSALGLAGFGKRKETK